ncbi:unnamed protein product [Zymoseptoria tritici ST99CH_1A5]|uniref:Uncharacterized protein n=1 Tax=Zymoseptoria tritici ST99CH_1A5 TaxID=1276529 RepID=A0A1Y6LE23_ZYMTR|nr:unnamed protein product [Zymoseptoria tritici ST99CH_1A5]
MESPSIQLETHYEPSMLDIDGPPSSPFVSEIEQSRMASKHWVAPPSEENIMEENTVDISSTSAGKASDIAADIFMEDKENMQETAHTTPHKATPLKAAPATQETKATPQGVRTTPIESPRTIEQRRGSQDSDLMPPPPSTRRTPKRSPLKPTRSAANTPRATHARTDSHDAQTPKNFQQGLDFRASQMPPQDQSTVDDTCFSAFSEVPDMTVFAKIGQSATKTLRTPGHESSRKRPSPSRSPSPTPRRMKTPGHGSQMNNDGTTSFLIDFTQQMEGVNTYRQHSLVKSSTEPNLLQYMNSQRSPNKGTARQSYATPGKPNNILNLLDFELPPAPTPRSIPTITVRELESLKSSYLSQISSLKATLSGREAEVESLKRAVGDAERRVGEAQESLREEKSRREYAEQEKAGWEKRGQEVENVLKSVKEEIYNSEAEKEELHRKIEDQERKLEDAEGRAVKAEERFADALAARAPAGDGCEEGSATEEQVQRLVAAQIDSKIEAVSRELHSVYKEKHERKVATLKKSYEARNAQKCGALEARLQELEKAHDELLASKDATFTGDLSHAHRSGGNAEVEAELKAQIEEQRAHLARLDSEMQASRQQQDQLMHDLEQERIEKGDLVAAVDEMLLLQSEQGPTQGAMSVVEDFRKSISRPSGLRAPGGMAPPESRIGRSIPSGLARAGSNAGKSKILSSIERMGRSNSGSHE